MRAHIRGIAAIVALGLASTVHAEPGAAVVERSIAQLQAQMSGRGATAVSLTRAYLARIGEMDSRGPMLHSLIAINPDAVAQARALDAERRAGHVRGPMHGVPLVIKDNIETADRMATTAGSLALAGNVTRRDAPLVARLRAAGAVILGKTNLSEWANIRSSRSISGWSATGGLVRNPYALDRNACGSSSGTAASVAASFAAAGVGTETDGSITCPAAMAGLVGLKPTVGLVSRAHIVPISHSQDTAGPMGRAVSDVAALLSVIAGSDAADPATAAADAHRLDYVAALAGASLAGRRIGVLRYAAQVSPAERAVFETALATLRAGGAEVVDIADFRPAGGLGPAETKVLMTELKVDLNAYLATTHPAQVASRNLADVIAFNRRTPRELALFGQEAFEAAQATAGLADHDYLAARAASLQDAGVDGIDKLLADHRLDALVAPTTGTAWRTDVVDGDHDAGEGATRLAAVAGYPHLTVPMGDVRGLPVGLSFIGGAWSEATLLRLGYAYEQASRLRRAPSYRASIETDPAVAPILAAPSR